MLPGVGDEVPDVLDGAAAGGCDFALPAALLTDDDDSELSLPELPSGEVVPPFAFEPPTVEAAGAANLAGAAVLVPFVFPLSFSVEGVF
jgi:hypothetical protein